MISMIAAMDPKGVIGNKGTIPWHIKEDFKLFKEKTLNSSVIMGRKTFESIGKPLPQRENIVLSSTLQAQEGIFLASSLKEALNKATHDVFIIGGSQLYKEALPLADRLCLSFVKKEYEGDTYFPKIDYTQWRLTEKQEFEEFTYKEFTR